MTVAFVNNKYCPHKTASINIEDRGLQFGDAVYEVVTFFNSLAIDLDYHFERLARSLKEMKMKLAYSDRILKFQILKLAKLNQLKYGIVYIQVSRGTAPRNHSFYGTDLKSNVIITTKHLPDIAKSNKQIKPQRVKTVRDNRWQRVDIKTTNLLPNCLAKSQAQAMGYDDVWFVDNKGYITEASAANAWIVSKNGDIITREKSASILGGITRARLHKLCSENNLEIIFRPFHINEALSAKEAFISSATNFVNPVIEIDNISINNGEIGKISQQIRNYYLDFMTAK